MAKVSARTATWAKWAAVPAALLVSGVAVSQASYSAFSSKVESTASNWAAGTVVLGTGATTASGPNAATAMFTAPNMKPGDGGFKCITVTSSGTLDSVVKLYPTAPSSTNGLSKAMTLTVEAGTGADDPTCKGFVSTTTVFTGTLEAFSTAGSEYAKGIGAWDTNGGKSESRTYKITYALPTGAPSTTMGGTANVGFTWEAQNK